MCCFKRCFLFNKDKTNSGSGFHAVEGGDRHGYIGSIASQKRLNCASYPQHSTQVIPNPVSYLLALRLSEQRHTLFVLFICHWSITMMTYFDWNYVQIYCADIKQFIGAFFTSPLTEFVCEEVRSNRSASTKRQNISVLSLTECISFVLMCSERLNYRIKWFKCFYKKSLGNFNAI